MNTTFRDLTGQRFNMLVAIEPTVKRDYNSGGVYWLCLCKCGNKIEVRRDTLINNMIYSCGCEGENEVDRWLKRPHMKTPNEHPYFLTSEHLRYLI